MTHLLAILGLGALCALWVVLQRAAGGDATGVGGGCRGGCTREDCPEQTDRRR